MNNFNAKAISAIGLEALLQIVNKLPADECIVNQIYPEIRIAKESIESLYRLAFTTNNQQSTTNDQC
jgi:hypothetical protein